MIDAGTLLPDQDGQIGSSCNTRPFAFTHGLDKLDLFTPAALSALAARQPRFADFVVIQNGKIKVDDRWDTAPAPRLTLEETIAGIETNDSLIIFKHVEQDPEYAGVFQEVLQRIFDRAPRQLQDDVTVGECLIFMNSPRRKTAYHIDLECNFLAQIRGSKTVRIYDGADRTLLSEEEIEGYCAGDPNAARWRPERADDCGIFAIGPGEGVHIPTACPHWVENGDEPAVSVSLNFELRSVHDRAQRTRRVNAGLRRLGLSPAPLGRNPGLDDAKAIGLNAFRTARRSVKALLNGPDPADVYPVWRPLRPAAGAVPSVTIAR